MKKLRRILSLFLLFSHAVFAAPTLIEKTIQEQDKQINAGIEIHYPQIADEKLSDNAIKFNQMVESKIQSTLKQFKQQASEGISNPKIPAQIKTSGKNSSYLLVKYQAGTAELNQDILIGVGFEIEQMIVGYAHPWTNLEEINFNLNTGKTVNLKNLFVKNSNYLQVLSNYALKNPPQIYQDNPQLKNILLGLAPTAENYQHWFILQNGLMIRWDQYHFNIGRSEIQSLLIPFTELQKAGLLE